MPEQTRIKIIDHNGGDTERTDNIDNLLMHIPIWWSSIFEDSQLQSIAVIEHGVNCSFLLNNEYVLKVLLPKHTWCEIDPAKDYQSICNNYSIVHTRGFASTPEVLHSSYSEQLKAFVILTRYVQCRELFDLYYLADFEDQKKYIHEFVELIKQFHTKLTGYVHEDLHFSNILVEPNKRLYLIDFDNLQKGEPFDELSGIMQGLLLPSCIVTEELEEHYQKPLFSEFERIIQLYPALLPPARIDEAKLACNTIFEKKKHDPKFESLLEPVYYKVFNDNWFERIAQQNK
jgi:serine/threonine protein kinase